MPNNPLLVTVSAVYAAAGGALLFAPDEILALAGMALPPVTAWLAGMFGGALLGFALLNWFSRQSLMGGIYGRPLLLANLVLLSNVTFSSLRMWRGSHATVYAVAAITGGVFLVAFGRLLFHTPAAVGRPPAA